jgi:phenylacetate-CoA ligase
MNKIRKIPFLPYEEIKKEQERRLHNIIDYAYGSVPYYRRTLKNLDLKPENFKTIEDLHKLPLISKEDIQKKPNDFVSPNQKDQFWVRTSGSTGQPTNILWSKDFLISTIGIGQRFRDAFASSVKSNKMSKKARLSYPGSGSEILDKYYMQAIWALKYTYYKNKNFRMFSIFDSPKKNYILLKKLNPQIVAGHGSYIGLQFSYMAQKKLELPNLNVVTYSSDHLKNEDRRIIEDHYCQVFAHYNAMETSTVGFECEDHRGYHLSIDTCAVDIMNKDGIPASPREEGEIVVSNLINKGTVLLNYRLGDIGVMDDEIETCECGRNLPMLRSLIGRSDDIIALQDGTILHPRLFWTIFKKRINQIIQYKFIQEDYDKYTVFCLLDDEYEDEMDEIERDLTNDLERILGESEIKIRFVSEIPRSEGGKLRSVESRIRQN